MKWYRFEAKQKDRASIMIYEQIGQTYSGEGVSAKEFVRDLRALQVKDIDIHINSPGGNVFDGNSIYNALRSHKARISVKIDGIAASIASVIAMSGDTVSMPENAMMMIHDPSGLVIGTAQDMEKMAGALRKIKGGLVAAYRNKAGLADEKISEMMTAETWLTAKEAVDHGFADEMTAPVTFQANIEALSQYKNVPQTLFNKGPVQGSQWKTDAAIHQAASALNDQLRNGQTPMKGGIDVERDQKTTEERARATWNADPRLQEEFSGFEAYFAYIRAVEQGRVKIIGKK